MNPHNRENRKKLESQQKNERKQLPAKLRFADG